MLGIFFFFFKLGEKGKPHVSKKPMFVGENELELRINKHILIKTREWDDFRN